MPSDIEAAIAYERRRDAVALHCTAKQYERARGVRWSGCGPEPAPRPRSEAELRGAAEARLAALQSWRSSVDGRLARAIAQARRAAERAYAITEAAQGALTRGDAALMHRCSDAAEVIEAQGRDLIAAADATREAIRMIGRPAGPGA